MASSKRLERLNQLVDELLLEKPNEKKLQDLMLALGMPYDADPVQRMNRVLVELHRGVERENVAEV